MNPEIKAKWISALKSGEYKQGKNSLKYDNKFCCLGVLCDIAAKEGQGEWLADGYFNVNDLGGDTSVLPTAIQTWSGLHSAMGLLPRLVNGNVHLAQLNDSGHYTFEQIADIIEEQF